MICSPMNVGIGKKKYLYFLLSGVDMFKGITNLLGLGTLFHHPDGATNKVAKESAPTQDESNHDGVVWVHLWGTSTEGVGHASIQVGGDKPKINPQDTGQYMS